MSLGDAPAAGSWGSSMVAASVSLPNLPVSRQGSPLGRAVTPDLA